MAFAFADTFRRLSLLPFRANISTLQGSLHVTGCGFALLSQEDTTLYHPGTRAAPPVTQKHWLPATRRPDPYRDRTASGDRLADDSLSGHTSEWLGYLTTHYGRRPFTASKNNASNRSRSAFIATRMMIPLSLSSVRPLSAPSSSTTIKDIS